MITYYIISHNPRLFKSFFGVTVAEFEALYKKLLPVWYAYEQCRLSQCQRQRAIGGGRHYTLSLRNRLLMTMMWLKLYLNTSVLGFLFGVDGSTASRDVRNLLPALRAVGESTLGWLEPPKRGQTKNLAQAVQEHPDLLTRVAASAEPEQTESPTQAVPEYPDLLAIVDATEQRVRRSGDEATQREHYSGKKKCHTRKTQIIVNERGVIRDVSHSTPGHVHDLEHFRQSEAPERIPEQVGVGGDAGYQGLQDELPQHSVATTHKARRGHPLTQAEKDINREFSGTRIVVENTICELKHFKVLAERFRHHVNLYDDAFRAVVAIVNPRIAQRVAVTLNT
jgi:hypothetical protein